MQDVNTIDLIKKHEGFRSKAYQCSAGVWTIGWGHTKGVKEGDTCAVAQAEAWFFDDLVEAITDASQLFGFLVFSNLSHNRQAVLIDMMFNLGYNRLKGFVDMRAAIRKDLFEAAADEMMDSLWATQVGSRADNLAEMMLHG